MARKKLSVVPQVSSVAPSQTPIDRRLLPLKDAATYAGTTLWFMRTLVWTKRIGHVVLGKRTLVSKHDLDCYIESKFVNAEAA